MAIGDWLQHATRNHPERTAVLDGSCALSYGELEERVAAAARALGAMRETSGGGVLGLELRPSVAFAVALHAAWRAGWTPAPLGGATGAGERQASLERLGVDTVLDDPAALEPGAGDPPIDAPPARRPDAPALRLQTSGTTGLPRRVELTFGNLEASAGGVAASLDLGPGDRWLCSLPLNHVGGLKTLVRAAVTGGSVELHEGFDAGRVADSLERGATGVSLVATTLERLLRAGAPLERARVALVGGGPVPGDLLEEAAARGVALAHTYGLTEASSQVTVLPPSEAPERRDSAGRPIPGVEVRIAAADGAELPPGEEGEILVAGPTVAPASRAADGRLWTGDLGVLDSDGYLTVTGRRGELIVTGGENVSPVEVEEVLRGHPAVADAAVLGRPDPEWQEAVTALVVLAPGHRLQEQELRDHCRSRLAPFKVPKRIEEVASLPRTATGKLMRHSLQS